MKISGFTFVRNALKFDYPIVEAITSILPVCDEMIVNVGNSEDGTLDLIRSIRSDKIRITESVWDESLRTGGRILAQQTNIALRECTGDWCFYIQGDEILHEDYIPIVKSSAENYLNDSRVEGLLFNYLHFYGTYHYIGTSRRWYRREIRVIRNGLGIESFKDAQGFRLNGRRLRVKQIDAYIYHYGWVKPPAVQQEKQKSFNRLWHSDKEVENMVGKSHEFDYSKIDTLEPFAGTHPSVMKARAARCDWDFGYDPGRAGADTPLKHRLLNLIEKKTGYRIGEYRNYRII
ncbi:glycosyltransferase family 2 protein [candidate division KSB1 bacterium]